MKLYIPEIGDHLRLTNDWTFKLYDEYRNKSLWDLYKCDESDDVKDQKHQADRLKNEMESFQSRWRRQGVAFYWDRGDQRDPAEVEQYNALREELQTKYSLYYTDVTIPVDSLLSVDRIFIRKGMDDWSSLTFYLKEHPAHTFKKKPRFWAKLADCNNIEFEQVKD
jgi:hypothetical protein